MKNAAIVSVAVGLSMVPAALCAQTARQPLVTIYTAPETNLEEIDLTILNQVGPGAQINFAAYALSDYAILETLAAAAKRGAKLRIYLDPREVDRLHLSDDHPMVKLWKTPGVEIRIKDPAEGLMHLKAYSINGSLLRTGSANDSLAGLQRQDNDLLVLTDKATVEAFDRKFEAMWARPGNTKFSYP